jgi:hypothetical protein
MSGDEDCPDHASNIVICKTDSVEANRKQLPDFIQENTETIVGDGETFARTFMPSATQMTPRARLLSRYRNKDMHLG